jgi:epoxyqueuosine reductase
MNAQELKSEALSIGFDLVGIAPAITPHGFTPFKEWLKRGFSGEMHYMTKHAAARHHPSNVMDGVRSIVLVGMNYYSDPVREDPSPHQNSSPRLSGKVSRYAWGTDYHVILRERLKQLQKFVIQNVPESNSRVVVDTAPILERDFSQIAGIGWIGKNTMLINKYEGSWLFLGGLLVDFKLEYDPPHTANHCGTCTRCLDACPTDAFAGPYQLDSRLCISYLTIELRSSVPKSLRPKIGSWVFGCDICQDVCPWNRKSSRTHEPGFLPQNGTYPFDLEQVLSLTEETFRKQFNKSTLKRPKRAGLLRNAAIALGNHGDPRSVPCLSRAMEDGEPLIRGAAAWALGKIGTQEAIATLKKHIQTEQDPMVQDELNTAILSTR